MNEEEIFAAAIQKDSVESRVAYLDEVCSDDSRLRAKIEGLLDAYDHPDSFLEPSIRGDICGALKDELDRPIAEVRGTVIGPYKLLEQIGEGGFGVVFLAGQEHPVRRRVALKLVKPGMGTREVIARFEAERQAVALMDHPNIAKVFDAGTTDTGRPYFAMEVVQGVPITEYCDQCNLPTRERLELFVSVCQAVQHAHQKGIIHRDIKPTNVLVAILDGRPAPKIIDFGVAKAINQQLTEHTLMTAFAQIVGTPLYMSPEQAELSPLGIDTRSDIYSLGVLLYELLTGTTPFDKDRLHVASYDELRRIIREEDPPRPSARISTLAADLATTVAERHRTDSRRLRQTVHGELDWIVMKCLEKDRNRRYDSTGGLARDVECYLYDEPVQACPPSLAYRLKKFVRRNKVAAAFISLLVVGLAALAVSNVMIQSALTQKNAALELALTNEQRATEEGKRAQAISDLLQYMLASSYPDRIKDSKYTVRELLDDFSAGLGSELAGQPEVEAAIRSVIGTSYWRLGVPDRADSNLKRSLDLHRKVYGANDERVANSLLAYVWNLGEQNRFAEAQECAGEAASIYEKLKANPQVTSSLADALYLTALAQLRQGDKAGYRATCKALVDLPVRTDDVVLNSRPIWPLCLAPNALDEMNRLVKRAEKYVAENSRRSPHFCLYVLGAAHYRAGNYEQAAQKLQESIDVYPGVPVSGRDTINYQRLLLAMTQWQLGRQHEARKLLTATQPGIVKELQAPSMRWNRRTSLELLRDEAVALIGKSLNDEAFNDDDRNSAKTKSHEP